MFPSPGTRQKAGGGFPKGTRLLFQQSLAPLGWKKDLTKNDYGLRVVSGNVGVVSGQTAFSTVFGQTATGASTLSIAQLAAHDHTYGFNNNTPGCTLATSGANNSGANTNANTGSTGSGSSHTHTVALNLNYVDTIIAQKS